MQRAEHPTRACLLEAYAAALRAVDGRAAVRERLRQKNFGAPVYALAIGKAAAAMLQGAFDALGENIAGALLITKLGHADLEYASEQVRVLEAEHPVPGAGSLAAGQALLDFLAALPPRAPLLCLISGGASALVEVLPEGMTLTDLQALNAWLLSSGWDIARMNRLRRAFSCIKGGRLLAHVGQRPTLNLLISDVPGDDSATIGSGLLVPPRQGESLSLDDLPDNWRALLPKRDPVRGEDYPLLESEILLTNRHAREAAAAYGRTKGLRVFAYDEPLVGDAVQRGRDLAQRLLRAPSGLHVWGGETTVRLPQNPGRGGRCQSLALAAAEVLAGGGIALLAAGTDGSDGPGEDAGALVDGQTLLRGADEGLNAGACLQGADAGRFLEASGDLLHTGPTGSNVMDLVLACKP